jgi:hypothetical protein
MVLSIFAVGGDAKFASVRAIGITFFVLGMGTFHELAPWTLMHELPIFSSQHVPSRFFYVAVLLMMTGFAAVIGKLVDRYDRRWPWVSLLFLAPAWWIGVDIANVGAIATTHVFFLESPKIEPYPAFVQSEHPQYDYSPPASRAGASLLAMERNEGFVDCDLVPGSAKPHGAISRTSPGYRGEAYVADGPGTASVVEWSPSHAVVQYAGVRPGSTIAYNMNWDPGWNANGEPALEIAHAVAATVTTPSGRVEFRYRPRSLASSLALFFVTILVIGFGPARRLYRRRQLG